MDQKPQAPHMPEALNLANEASGSSTLHQLLKDGLSEEISEDPITAIVSDVQILDDIEPAESDDSLENASKHEVLPYSTIRNISNQVFTIPQSPMRSEENVRSFKNAPNVQEGYPNKDDYTVAWICTRPSEIVAARLFLDEFFPRPVSVPLDDNNTYYLGRVSNHNVVISIIPKSGEDSDYYAIGVNDMLNTFPNIRVSLYVGVGGGVPSHKHDIRLGDVVVGVSANGGNGVLEYDFERTMAATTLQPTRFQYKTSRLLQGAVLALEGQHDVQGTDLSHTIHQKLENHQRLREKCFSYRRDLFFESTYSHLGGQNSRCEYICETYRAVSRPNRFDDIEPVVHYGPIASAKRPMRNALVRENIAEATDILCLDEEAASLMVAFPGLAIRGICDYSDSHNYQAWENYAAMTAAAYATDLLKQIHSPETTKPSVNLLTPAITTGFSSEPNRGGNIRMRVPTTKDLHSESPMSETQHRSHLVSEKPQPKSHDVSLSASTVPSAQVARSLRIKPQSEDVATSNSISSSISRVLTLDLINGNPRTDNQSSIRYFAFHQTTLIVILIIFPCTSCMMAVLAVTRKREHACVPNPATVQSDDGFWALLSQLALQMSSAYCTMYPVVVSDDIKISVANFWFWTLLVISFLSAVAATGSYSWSWQAATMLGLISGVVQVVSSGQLAFGLYPKQGNDSREVARAKLTETAAQKEE